MILWRVHGHGDGDGLELGEADLEAVGDSEGVADGEAVGLEVGLSDGVAEGVDDGEAVTIEKLGEAEACPEAEGVSEAEGELETEELSLGEPEATGDPEGLGLPVIGSEAVGCGEGETTGDGVGDPEAVGVPTVGETVARGLFDSEGTRLRDGEGLRDADKVLGGDWVCCGGGETGVTCGTRGNSQVLFGGATRLQACMESPSQVTNAKMRKQRKFCILELWPPPPPFPACWGTGGVAIPSTLESPCPGGACLQQAADLIAHQRGHTRQVCATDGGHPPVHHLQVQVEHSQHLIKHWTDQHLGLGRLIPQRSQQS